MSLYGVRTVLHVSGAAIGVGAAAASDSVFLSAIRNRRVSDDQYVLIRATAHVVLAGLALLFLTGVALLLHNVAIWEVLHFQAKMTAVVVLMANGVVFHATVIPMLGRHRHETLPERMLTSKQWLFALTGSVSGVSWLAALVLAVVGEMGLSYLMLMVIYLLLVAGGAVVGYLLLSHLIFRPGGAHEGRGGAGRGGARGEEVEPGPADACSGQFRRVRSPGDPTS